MSELEVKTMKGLNATLIILGGLLAIVAMAVFSGAVYEVLFNLQADPASISQSVRLAYWSAIGPFDRREPNTTAPSYLSRTPLASENSQPSKSKSPEFQGLWPAFSRHKESLFGLRNRRLEFTF
jgi:hypothetical protein